MPDLAKPATSTLTQWWIQSGFHEFHGTPLLKGCLQKYYVQTYYVHFAHTRASHFSFTVPITHVCQPNNFSRMTRARPTCTYIYYQKHMATIETMSEAREWIKVKVFIHALLPLQLGMVICYQYESAYFPMPYANSELLCSLCDPKRNHSFDSAGSKHSNYV